MRSRGLTRAIAMIGACVGMGLFGGGVAGAVPLHWVAPGSFAQPPTTATCEAQSGVACYQPYQFQQAYNMNPLYQAGLTGKGKTIVIVDSFGSPTIENDQPQPR